MSSKRDLYSVYEIRGQWFFPRDKKTVHGTLHYNKNNSYLTTDGFVGDKNPNLEGQNTSSYPKLISTIQGWSNTGEKVTLFNCELLKTNISKRTSFDGPAIAICTYSIEIMIMGEWYESESSIIFNKLSIKYSNLEQWHGMSGLKSGPGDSMSSFNASLEHVPISEGQLNDNLKIKICTIPELVVDHGTRTTTLSEEVVWQMESKKMLSFQESMELANCFRCFLMLGIGTGVYTTSLVGIKNDISVEIFPNTVLEEIVERDSDRMYFLYHHINDNFSEHLQKWYKIWNNFYDELITYFSIVDSPNQYMLTSKFLTIAVGFESVHRKLFNMEDCDYIVRIKELINHNKNAFNDAKSERDPFAKNVKNTRNYLAHGNYKNKIKAKTESDELFVLVNEMQILFELCLINKLPFDEQSLNKISYSIRKEKNYFRDNAK